MRVNRRDFINNAAKTGAAAIASASVLTLMAVSQQHGLTLESRLLEPGVLRPPGALDEPDFLARCIRCLRCQDSCPTGAIRLAAPSDLYSPGTPFISAPDTACNLCLACTQSCPTEALQPVTDRKAVRMGLAVVDKRTCVSHNGTGVCGACHTACPFRNKAITQGLRNAPAVHEEFCVGCGLCEEACIVDGIKAIRVFSGRQAA